MSSEIQAVLSNLFDSRWKHFCLCDKRIRGVYDYALYIFTFYM